MTHLSQSFFSRASRIPFLGLGLSVDVYSPNLLDLVRILNGRQLSFGYLEIFQAHPHALRTIRTQMPGIPMAYHAEGLWFTQPGWAESEQAYSRLAQIGQDLEVLDAWWVNQECATKEIAGRVFGTYVPPLFTLDSARLTAQQACEAQAKLDVCQWGAQGPPLLLLEVPPLTYFGIGDLSYPEFFARVAEGTPCGFVLDIGHVWTAYRYVDGCSNQAFEAYFETFLEGFPLDRVIQIHVAGLACHPSVKVEDGTGLGVGFEPWVDFHPAPIPQELLGALGQVLRDPRLRQLKGLALEVDNKDVSLICRELDWVRGMFGDHLERISQQHSGIEKRIMHESRSQMDASEEQSQVPLQQELAHQYLEYLSLLTGKNTEMITERMALSTKVNEGLQVYATQYLPQEILSWGGDISEMFPLSCDALKHQGVKLERFVEFWFGNPGSGSEMAYDFFLMKIQRFVEFIYAVLPEEASVVDREADILREGYRQSCQDVRLSEEVV